MKHEFKTIKSDNETRYVLETASAGGTSAGAVASVSQPLGAVQRRTKEETVKVPVTQKPRQGVLKTQTGGGKHRDKKKEMKAGKEKHRKPFAETSDDFGKRAFKRQELDFELRNEPPNNIQVVINGKPWKVFAGRGRPDSVEEKNHLRKMQAWAASKSAATGKKWEVYLTGAAPTAESVQQEGLRDPKDNPCWKGYKPVGTKKKGGRTVPNCVPKEGVDVEESGLQYYTGVKKHGKEYMVKAAQAARNGASQAELGALKDKYSKAYKEGHDEPDHEISMASNELTSVIEDAMRLLKLVRRYSEMEGLEAWQQSKITKAADYLNAVLNSLQGKAMFNKEDHSNFGGGWGQGSYDTYAGGRHGRGVAEGSKSNLVYISTDSVKAFEDWMESEGLETDVPKRDEGTYVVYDYSDADHRSKMYANEWNEKQSVAEGSLEEVNTRTLVNYVPKAGRTLASLSPDKRKKRSGMMTRAYQKLIPRPDFSDEIKKYQDEKNKKGVAEGWKEKAGAASLAGSMALGGQVYAAPIGNAVSQGLGAGITSAAISSVADNSRNASDTEFAKQIPNEVDRAIYLKELKRIKHSRAMAYASPALIGANAALETKFKKLQQSMAEKYNIQMPVKEESVAEEQGYDEVSPKSASYILRKMEQGVPMSDILDDFPELYRMMEIIAGEQGLHMDDDFEQIEDILMNDLEDIAAQEDDFGDYDPDEEPEDKYMESLATALTSALQEKAPPGDKYERMVKHIKKGYAKDGDLTAKEKSIAYATAWKAKNQAKK